MANDKVDPIQEQLIAARQNQILDAATKVFAEKGFERATIRDVAKTAGVADGTIYNYFENKTALMLGILNRLNETDRRQDDMAQATEMDLRGFFTAYLKQRYDLFTQDGLEVFRAVLPEVMTNKDLQEQYLGKIVEPTFEGTEQYFEQLIAQGKVRPMDVPLALRVISATTLGLLVLRLLDEPVVVSQWDKLPEILTAMTLDGIVGDK